MRALPTTAAVLALALASRPAAAAQGAADLASTLPAWTALPFVGILLSIALFPLLAPRFWHHHYPAVAAAWALLLGVPLVAAYGSVAAHEILHMALVDYAPFVILLGTLFTISGGIHLRGSLRGSPVVNAAILAIGTFLASWIGTTGAAILLIRPLLRANRERRRKVHTVVFFIFLVANIGGALTPLGDPPLFLGFLHGVPFFWTVSLWKEMLLVTALTLGVYVALDTYHWRREDPSVRAERAAPGEPFRVEGWHNLLLLAGALAAVIASGVFHLGPVSLLGVKQELVSLLRDAVLLLMATVSWLTTARGIRKRNEFGWGPIREVAILFAGIFTTIIPPLLMLRAGEHGALGFLVRSVDSPAEFFWATGMLSSLLDNAPTYLSFLSLGLGRLFPGVPEREAILRLIADHNSVLQAIAVGAVFMGANTYIGNAPNFMVKSIAEEAGVEMPSFFGYIVRYALTCLGPIFLIVTWVFFS
jgi:Na+/H+ antiporter NhaD/arsenite permease-like protein